jgi:hypothetical protein
MCGHCGYDLAATPADLCPECGRRPSDWDFKSDGRVRSLRWVHLGLACLPLLWVVSANGAFVAARITLGSWPNRANHPGATVPLAVLYWGLPWFMLVVPLAPAVLWHLIGRRVGKLTPSGSAAASLLMRTVVVCVLAWGSTVWLVWWDPLGAVEWMSD